MAWSIVSPQICSYQPIDETSTTKRHDLGTEVTAIDESSTGNRGTAKFIYLTGVASTEVGSVVAYFQDDWTTALLDTDNTPKQDVAVAMSASVASNYGWYMVSGKASAKVLAGFADNADVYATSTGGSVDDAVVDGYLVHKARGASAISGGLADLEINYPYTDGIATND
jgi:hypothetical protein